MTHQPTIAVTGVTGRIGGAVATELQDLTPRLRLLVRNPSRAPRLEGQLAVADYSDAAASREALAGVDVLFMVSAGESPERVQQHEVFVDAAAAAGVKHIVYTSFLGPSRMRHSPWPAITGTPSSTSASRASSGHFSVIPSTWTSSPRWWTRTA